jgi:hypothetical protein
VIFLYQEEYYSRRMANEIYRDLTSRYVFMDKYGFCCANPRDHTGGAEGFALVG